jgi:hypothetical protein
MEFDVECRSKKTKKYVENLMPKLIKLLGIKNSKHLVLVRVADEIGMDEGITVPVKEISSYIVVIKPGSAYHVGVTLAHEMIHVKQLSRGYLKLQNGVSYWCGKRYRKNTKYMDRPWELDAFSKQEIIFRRALADAYR